MGPISLHESEELMKRGKSILVLGCMLITIALVVMQEHSRAQNANRQTGVTNTESSRSDSTAPVASPVKRGKLLVKRLPEGVEGVEIKDGAIHLKEGFKFVKEGKGKVVVARMRGNNATGSWSCACTGENRSGSCEEDIEQASLLCNAGSCTGTCKLSVVVKGATTAIFAY